MGQTKIKKMKKIEIFFYNSKFPKNGWIQQCICCGMPTSYLEDTGYYKDRYHFFSYLCFKCKKKKHIGNNEISRKFYDTIKRYMSIFLIDK